MNCENDRLLFPKIQLVKKELRERFLVITRHIYKHHETYPYKDKQEDTAIVIQDGHAFNNQDGKLVRLVAKVGSYSLQLNDTFKSNMTREVYKNGQAIGQQVFYNIPVPITVLVQAYTEEEASDVADELLLLVLLYCKSQYSSLGLVPRSGHVSETDVFNAEQEIYQTTLSFVFEVPWTITMTNEKDIIDQIFIDLDLPKTVDPLPYRSPEVNVYVKTPEDLEYEAYLTSFGNLP